MYVVQQTAEAVLRLLQHFDVVEHVAHAVQQLPVERLTALAFGLLYLIWQIPVEVFVADQGQIVHPLILVQLTLRLFEIRMLRNQPAIENIFLNYMNLFLFN